MEWLAEKLLEKVTRAVLLLLTPLSTNRTSPGFLE